MERLRISLTTNSSWSFKIIIPTKWDDKNILSMNHTWNNFFLCTYNEQWTISTGMKNLVACYVSMNAIVNFSKGTWRRRGERIASLSKDVFERHSSTGSDIFSLWMNMPWNYQNYIAYRLYPCRDDLPENLGKSTAQECTVHFWLTPLAQKRLCLSSLICLW